MFWYQTHSHLVRCEHKHVSVEGEDWGESDKSKWSVLVRQGLRGIACRAANADVLKWVWLGKHKQQMRQKRILHKSCMNINLIMTCSVIRNIPTWYAVSTSTRVWKGKIGRIKIIWMRCLTNIWGQRGFFRGMWRGCHYTVIASKEHWKHKEGSVEREHFAWWRSKRQLGANMSFWNMVSQW